VSTPEEHEWWEWRGMTCCKKCGIVKRTHNPLSGKKLKPQKKCPGVVPITLRSAAAALIDAIDHRHSTAPGHFKYVVPWDEARILGMALDMEALQS